MRHRIIGIVSLLALCGCEPTLFMGGATAVVTSASEERGFTGSVSDKTIKVKIQYQWHTYKPELVDKINITVHQGRVLLTGIVEKTELQIEAIRLARKVSRIKEIINEIRVGKGQSFTQHAKDSWITTQLNSKIFVDDEIRSLNYDIGTIEGIVYLIGIAQNKQELDRVLNYARHIKGVRKVTSYVTLKGDSDKSSPSSRGAPPLPRAQASSRRTSSPSEIQQESLNEDTPHSREFLEPAPIEEREDRGEERTEEPFQDLNSPNTGSSFQ